MSLIYIRIGDSYLGVHPEQNPLNQHQVICSTEKDKQLWIYDNKTKTIQHVETKGFLSFPFHGWTPSRSNIILQKDYILDFQPLHWEYKDGSLITIVTNEEFILGKDCNKNIVLQKNNNHYIRGLLDIEWEFIEL